MLCFIVTSFVGATTSMQKRCVRLPFRDFVRFDAKQLQGFIDVEGIGANADVATIALHRNLAVGICPSHRTIAVELEPLAVQRDSRLPDHG